MFDDYFFKIFNYYKPKLKVKANNIALLYVFLLQTSLLLAIGTFLLVFLNQMHVDVLSTSKAWTLFIIVMIIIVFRNWIYYTGKNRKVLNTKSMKSKKQSIWLLWLIPLVCLVVSVLLMQRI